MVASKVLKLEKFDQIDSGRVKNGHNKKESFLEICQPDFGINLELSFYF